MLSKDPIVQAPAFSQSYNGYAYAWNNPLKYNDPSGYANALSQDAYIPYEDRRGGWGGPVYDPMSEVFSRSWSRNPHNTVTSLAGYSMSYNWIRAWWPSTPPDGDNPGPESSNLLPTSHVGLFGLQSAYQANLGVTFFNRPQREAFAQGGGTPDWVNRTIGATSATNGYFQAGYLNDAKQTYKYAQRINGKVRSANTITRANRISSLSSAKNLSRVGGGLTFLAAGATVYDGLTGEAGWQNHHTADLAVTGAIYLTAASFPVVGWIAGGLYFAADLTTQYYTGKSITQNLFNP